MNTCSKLLFYYKYSYEKISILKIFLLSYICMQNAYCCVGVDDMYISWACFGTLMI